MERKDKNIIEEKLKKENEILSIIKAICDDCDCGKEHIAENDKQKPEKEDFEIMSYEDMELFLKSLEEIITNKDERAKNVILSPLERKILENEDNDNEYVECVYSSVADICEKKGIFPEISRLEKNILSEINVEYKYIARGGDGNLYIMKRLPKKEDNYAVLNDKDIMDFSYFNQLFKYEEFNDILNPVFIKSYF